MFLAYSMVYFISVLNKRVEVGVGVGGCYDNVKVISIRINKLIGF
jgi:hypothetical protein